MEPAHQYLEQERAKRLGLEEKLAQVCEIFLLKLSGRYTNSSFYDFGLIVFDYYVSRLPHITRFAAWLSYDSYSEDI